MNKVTLSDGRDLTYEEYGSRKGKPVFYFHGWPASRLSGKQLDKPAKKLGLRIISPDRPGFGKSTLKKNRKLLDWLDDVVKLADHLNLKRFSILGASGGAPYVYACANKIPKRLNSAVVVAGLGPIQEILNNNGAPPRSKFIYKAACYFPHSVFFSVILYHLLQKYLPKVYRSLISIGKPEIDKIHLAKPESSAQFIKTTHEAFRQGPMPVVQEAIIYLKDWGFHLIDIKKEIILWHGTSDKNAPFWMGKYAASQLPNCKTHFLKNKGHFLLMDIGKEILAKSI